MKPGTRVEYESGGTIFKGVVHGPEDWSGYERNRPSEKWELVLFDNGEHVWCPNYTLKEIK